MDNNGKVDDTLIEPQIQMPPPDFPAATTHEENIDDQDMMDRTIEVAAKLDAYEKSVNAVTNFIIRRCYDGDWVCHDRKEVAMEHRKANIGSAAAERIARDLGVQERRWAGPWKVWSDDKKDFTILYEAEFGFAGRWVKARGQSGTRNKFYSKARGERIQTNDINEDNIRMDAFRCTRKEGVRALFGIRRIPLLKLQELGFNLAKVQYVDFQTGAESIAGKSRASGEATKDNPKIEVMEILITSATVKKSGTGSYIALATDKGFMAMWGDETSDAFREFTAAKNSKTPIKVETKWDGKYLNVSRIMAEGVSE